jgi:hypothetical protein
MRRAGLAARSTMVLLLVACGEYEPLGTPGSLREGGFRYCETGRGCDSQPIPDFIGVGSTFGMQFSRGDVVLESGTPDRLERLLDSEDDFRVLRAGTAIIEARADYGNELLDYVYVAFADVRSLHLRLCERAFNAIRSPGDRFDRDGCHAAHAADPLRLVIARGESLAPTLCVLPLDSAGGALAGHFPIHWAVSPESEANLQLNVGSDPRCATIGGLTLGTARITARLEDFEQVLEVVVEP